MTAQILHCERPALVEWRCYSSAFHLILTSSNFRLREKAQSIKCKSWSKPCVFELGMDSHHSGSWNHISKPQVTTDSQRNQSLAESSCLLSKDICLNGILRDGAKSAPRDASSFTCTHAKGRRHACKTYDTSLESSAAEEWSESMRLPLCDCCMAGGENEVTLWPVTNH